MNHYDLEENSRTEMLVEFKLMYGEALNAMEQLLIKFRKEFERIKDRILSTLFFRLCLAFTHILLLRISKKKAMEEAKVNCMPHTVYELTFAMTKKLLE